MLRAVAVSAIVGYAAAFAPGAPMALKPSTRAVACSPQMAFGQNADSSAPPADLFNIWREDYMVSPNEAAAQAAEREANTIFDGVLPPFSNVGNTEAGKGLTSPTLSGVGLARDFSTANPTSAYDTATFGSVTAPSKDILPSSISGAGPELGFNQKGYNQGTARAAPAAGTQRAPQKRGGFFGRR